MPIQQTPELLENVLGYDAEKTDTIPATTEEGTGRFSYQSGFPPITGIPLETGGIAPRRQDFNAVINLMSQHLFWLQSGGLYTWDSTLCYQAGAHVLGSDGKEYICQVINGPDVTGIGRKDPTEDDGTYWQLASNVYAAGIATASQAGIVKPDNITITIAADGTISAVTATSSAVGMVKPDGKTITISDGTLSAATATASQAGIVKPDGSTITVGTDGTISVATQDDNSGKLVTGAFVWSYASSYDGCLLCNGAAVSRTTYADLYAVIGTKFGEGDGSTTFNLPDLRGRTMQGANSNLGTVLAAGLPNITGQREARQDDTSAGGHVWKDSGTGALSTDGEDITYNVGGRYYQSGITRNDEDVLYFDASNSNEIYGSSDTVQVPAVALNAFIKY